jgi:hypothetical protein
VVTTIEQFFKDNLNLDIKVDYYPGIKLFPLFLSNIYRFYKTTLLDVPCILLEPIQNLYSMDALYKHINLVKSIGCNEVVLVLKGITQYKRRSLITQRIPFIIEGKQIFLPFLGMHLSKTWLENKTKPKIFTPSAQLTFLYFLYGKIEKINATQLAVVLNKSVMSASRALTDLFDTNLLTYQVGGKTGKSKVYCKIPDPLFFKRGKEYLYSPIQKKVFVKKAPPNALMSGLEALARLTMLNPPEHRILAVGNQYLRQAFQNIHYFTDNDFDEMGIILEIWDYPPELFSYNDQVDLVSLYACLKDQQDERIKQALEEALRGESWYKD